ncbi:hypothetical protein HanXRQr2_Chr10g0428101 [Helianthus annuus]|uniref:Uncharacterized protein n=1 Tax=Helianthus annuus TaxID=4232 RepID=A0A9K3N3I8_HELAN|nr:hypothetical protein HanXRQr2_Chr10g0428101 [Helianthus annuus]
MVRTKERAGASSSSSSKGKGKQPEEQLKKRQYLGRVSESESEEEEMMELDPTDKPRWESGPLDEQPNEWQATLFHDKMNQLKNKAAAFIYEREVREVEFWPFNVFTQFRALGWEAALSCYDKDNKNLFMDEIQEWMATLKCNKYDRPLQMKLTGEVNGISVEMSFDTLRKLHPRWNDMLAALFLLGTYSGILYRKNLKIEAKLLLTICILNVIPRRGDKERVRFPKVPILYSLLNGSPRFPIRYLIMNHLWICRNKLGRSIIPYCRIIMGLLKQFKAITLEDRGALKRHKPFEIQNMGIGWTYTQSERYHKLKSEGQRWRALKVDVRALLPGEEDEPESDAEPLNSDEDYADEPHGEHVEVGQGGPSRGHGGGFFDYTERSYEPNWAYEGTMQEVIENQHPPAPVFDSWSGSERTLFDQQTMMSASMERALKHKFDRQESWNRAHAYSHELEMNNRYEDDQARRMHADWHAGQPVVVDPPLVEYASLPPYDGSISYPTPPLHHSQWLDPRQQQGTSQQSGSGSGAFAFGEWSEMMSSIFGPPQPRYY